MTAFALAPGGDYVDNVRIDKREVGDKGETSGHRSVRVHNGEFDPVDPQHIIAVSQRHVVAVSIAVELVLLSRPTSLGLLVKTIA